MLILFYVPLLNPIKCLIIIFSIFLNLTMKLLKTVKDFNSPFLEMIPILQVLFIEKNFAFHGQTH